MHNAVGSSSRPRSTLHFELPKARVKEKTCGHLLRHRPTPYGMVIVLELPRGNNPQIMKQGDWLRASLTSFIIFTDSHFPLPFLSSFRIMSEIKLHGILMF